MKSAVKTFRSTFKRVTRELGKLSGCGFAFEIPPTAMKRAFREAMIAACVPSTQRRVELVNNWVARASTMGVAI